MKKLGIKEELEAEITNIKIKKIEEGKQFKREDLSELINIGVIMESYAIPSEGEYKDYFFEIDENYIVTVINKQKGEKPTIDGNVISTGFILEGGKVEIKVTASITEGKIASIEAINGAELKTNTSEVEKIFEVSSNGIYYFKARSDTGRSNVVSVKVDEIIEAPVINIKDVKYNGFTIEVTNNYPQGAITEYKYYIEGTLKSPSGTTTKEYIVTELDAGTEYKNIYVEIVVGEHKLVSNVKTATPQVREEKLVGSNITVNAPEGWDATIYTIENLNLSEYDRIKFVYSYKAGYEYNLGVMTDKDEFTRLFLSNGFARSHSTITRTLDIPKDKNYTKIGLEISSLSGVLQVDEIYLIKN